MCGTSLIELRIKIKRFMTTAIYGTYIDKKVASSNSLQPPLRQESPPSGESIRQSGPQNTS